MENSNRIIKFRAWGAYFSMGGSPEDKGEWIYWNPLKDKFPRPSMKWEGQFTGSPDKNGKDIYFDDIVQDEKGNKYHVTYHELSPSMIFKGIGCDTHYTIIYSSMHEYEVIGNIHETPELLK